MSKLTLRMMSLVAAALVLGAVSTTTFAQYNVPNPTEQENRQWRYKPCRDPWISKGIYTVTGGRRRAQGGDVHAECNPNLYNGGSWNSYSELLNAISRTLNEEAKNKVVFESVKRRDGVQVVALLDLNQGHKVLSGWLVGNDGASLTAEQIARLIGNDGAGLISNHSGKLIGTDGSSLIGTDGASLATRLGGWNGVAFGAGTGYIGKANNYSLQSGAKRVIRLNKSVIAIR
jgi:hypothetical protein